MSRYQKAMSAVYALAITVLVLDFAVWRPDAALAAKEQRAQQLAQFKPANTKGTARQGVNK